MPTRPQVAVGAVIRDGGARLLVVRRGHPPAEGRWTLPGGRLEPGERLEDAVRREVAEETGLEVTDVAGLVGHLEVADEDHHFVILDFHAELADADATPRAGDDVAEVAWMTRREIEEADTTDGLLDFLDRHGVELAPG